MAPPDVPTRSIATGGMVFPCFEIENKMRLAAKLILVFLIGLLLIVGLFSYLTIREQKRLAMEEHERNAADIAATIQPSIQEAIDGNDEQALNKIILESTSGVEHVAIRWIRPSQRRDGSPQSSVPVEVYFSRQIRTYSITDESGRDALRTYVPLEPDSEAGGHLEVSATDEAVDQRLRHSIVTSLLTLAGVATLSGIVIMLGGIVMVGRPLKELIQKVQRVGSGDFEGPLALKSNDELGTLAVALNEMCDKLANQRDQLNQESASRIATLEQLRHSDRLNTVGRMAAGIAHEIGTPLNVVSGRAELIAGGQLSPEATRDSAEAIRSEAQRITKIIRQLLDFARQTTPHPARQPIADVIESTATLMQPLAARHGVKLDVDIPDRSLDANIDAGQIQQVLTNLIINAIQATDQDGVVSVKLSEETAVPPDDPAAAPSSYRRISIQDNGSGISEQDLPHVFEPFFTTKDVGDGTGLGLSISHGIVREHGGWIGVQSQPAEGSRFSIFLPSPGNDHDHDSEGGDE